jgi:hypothetical protein
LLLTLTGLLARGGVAGAGAGDDKASLMGAAAALVALVRVATTEGEEILPPWPVLSTCCFIVCVNPRSSLGSGLVLIVVWRPELNTTKCQKGRCCLGGWQWQYILACSMWIVESAQLSSLLTAGSKYKQEDYISVNCSERKRGP